MLKVTTLAIGLGSIVTFTALPTYAAADEITATGPRQTAKSIAVNYGDLNLANQAGIDALTSRVRAAARKVCDVRLDRAPLREMSLASRCYRGSFEQAQADIGFAIARARDGSNLASLRTINVASR